MKALVKTSKASGVTLMDVDIPTIGPRDVLIKVKATAICGSDVHIYHSSPNKMRMVTPPVTIGHETCGEVVEIGDCVSNIKKSDMVSVEPHFFCGACYYCQTGTPRSCENLALFGTHVDGAFAEYARIPESCCWKLPKGYSTDLGAILEPLGVAVHGTLARDMDINGKSVAVFGCGPIGQFTLGVVTAFGAIKTFGVEVTAQRLTMARRLFPNAILINPKEKDPIKTITEATDGLGVDVAIELSGSAEAMRQALKVLKREGRISLVGTPEGPIELDVYLDIIQKEAKVLGVFGRVVWQTWWQVRNLLDSGKFDPLPVITHRLPLVDFIKAFELATSGDAGKILLYP